jgi:hypothetical protein
LLARKKTLNLSILLILSLMKLFKKCVVNRRAKIGEKSPMSEGGEHKQTGQLK